MPRYTVDYTNTYFYKLVCKDLNVKDCYVGHTTDFSSRKRRHKSGCNNTIGKHYNLYVYEFIREHGGWNNWDMILLETLSCENKLVARMKEREYIETLNATLNGVKRPYATKEELYETHRNYNINNREHRNEVLRVINSNLRKQNPERYKDYDKMKYERNKEKILEQQKERIICKCGKELCKGAYSRHLKTKVHQNFINNNVGN